MPAERDERDDFLLLTRHQRGEEAAFDELVRRYYSRALRTALTYLKERAAAEDVVQEAFLKVHRYAEQFQGQSSFSTWLYRIVVNVSIDHLRRVRRAPLESAMTSQDTQISEPDEAGFLPRDPDGNPAERSGRRELGEQIMLALEKLPEIHRSVIVLREVEGLSYEEIARALRIRKGTVMSRLFHARRSLATHLRPYLDAGTTNGG